MAVNYDPVKAHEYYVNYRKKGRKKGSKARHSVKGFSQTQKEQWAYAKHQLSEEHKAIGKNITATSQATRKSLSADAKARRDELSNACKEQISGLKERIKNASKEEKAWIREQVYGIIDQLRGQLRSDKEQISTQLKSDKEELTVETKGKREKEKKDYEVRKDVAYNKIKNKKGK